MTRTTSILARPATPRSSGRAENGPGVILPDSRATLSRRERITELRQRRAFYQWLGKRKRVAFIDAELVPLVAEELAHENLVAQVAADIEWIAGQEKAA